MSAKFNIGMIVGILVSVLVFGVLELGAQTASGKDVSKEKQSQAAKNINEKEKDPSKTNGKDAKLSGADKKAIESKIKQKPTERFKFSKDIRSLDDLEDDVDEDLENENIKVVYETPESCKEFTLYLDNKARKLNIKERRLKKRERALEQMTSKFKTLTQKFSVTEKRIKKVMQHDPTNLKGNPELTRMIKLYETFSPEEAAARLRNLDLDLTLAILKGMKPKVLSRVMSAMEPKLSAALSSQMVRGF